MPGSSTVVDGHIEQAVDSRLITPFCKPSGLVGITSQFTHILEPVRPLSKADREIQFIFPDLGTAYIALQKVKMYVRGNLTRADGTEIPLPQPGSNGGEESVNIVDNFVHSLFENVTLLLGRNQIEIQHCNYPFRSFVKQLSTYREKSAELEMACMTVDKGYSALPPVALAADRHSRISGSAETEFSDFVLADLFSCDSFLVPSFPVKIRFRRAPSSFYIVKGKENKQDYIFNIHEMCLKIPCVQVQHDILELLTAQMDNAVANYYFRGMNMMQIGRAHV